MTYTFKLYKSCNSRYLLAVILVWVLFAATLWAMPSDAPALTAEQKLQFQVVAQRLEIAQLKAQAAQRDFDAARADLQTLIKTLEKDGYTLDLATLTYVEKKKDAPK